MNTKEEINEADVSRYAARLRSRILSKPDYSEKDRQTVLGLVKIIESKQTNVQKMAALKKIANDNNFHKV